MCCTITIHEYILICITYNAALIDLISYFIVFNSLLENGSKTKCKQC